MNIIEKENIKFYHRSRICESSSYTLGYKTPDGQLNRLETVCEWGDMSNLTILDLGCGYGELKLLLDARFDSFTYLGVDFIPEFVELAEERFVGVANTRFLCVDFINAVLPQVDLVVASGSLNYRSSDPQHPRSIIEKMWQSASKGIAFNLLDKGPYIDHQLLCGYEQSEIFDFCRQLNPSAELRCGYFQNDFTIFMRR